MGAWGTQTFDDDTSCDWLDELGESEPVAFLEQSLAHRSDHYLEYEHCHSLVCSAEMIHGILVGPREGLPAEATSWIEQNSSLEVRHLRDAAVQGLDRVLADQSELHELWSENESDYPAWRGAIESLRSALQSA